VTAPAPDGGRFHRSRLARLPLRFAWEGAVAFQDVDAAGIVFFATIQTYFHETLVRFLDNAGQPLPAQLAAGAGMAPLVHAEADYLAPLRFGDRFTVGVVDAEVGASRVTLAYRLDGPAGPAATGCTVHVWVDPSFRKAPMPDGVRAAFTTASAPG
jgi:1,4-dihydroxy-2-naphthoyl-CoA hydrolase